jgi:hypothetical protein
MVMIFPFTGMADIIYLKDGTQVEAEKIWEEEGLVRFSLPEYDGIVITYTKEFVERIVRDEPDTRNAVKPTNDEERATRKSNLNDAPINTKNLAVPANSGSIENQGERSPIDYGSGTKKNMALVESVAGIKFYSARRPYKYQTGPDSKFHTFKEAIDDLAIKFEKDPYWIGQNLGNTNDLGKIYLNLNRPMDGSGTETEAASEASGVLFYDPRRNYKYWVASDSKHHTLDEAIAALASRYSRSPDWIINHLGDTNDLSEIHRNLEVAIAVGSGQ